MKYLTPLLFTLMACASAPAPTSMPTSDGPASGPSSGPASQATRAGQHRLEDSEAGRIVLRSINKHGGLDTWLGQGAIRFRYHYQPLPDGTVRNSVQTVDVVRSRVYHSLDSPAKGRFAFDGSKAWMKLDGDAKFGARFWALTPYYFVSFPFVLADPGVKLELIKDDPEAAGVEDSDVLRVTFEAGTGDAPDDYYIVYISKESHRVVALRYVVSFAPSFKGKEMKHTPEKLLVYSEYQEFDGILLAKNEDFFAFVDGKRGPKVTEARVSEIQVGAKFDEAKLTMPDGAVIDDPFAEQ